MLKSTKTLGICLKRYLNLHEYQASSLLASYGLATLKGGPASTPERAQSIANTIPGPVVIKAQAHTGGRGRGYFKRSKLQSGVHILEDHKNVLNIAKQMLDDVIITKQSGPEGKLVHTVYVVEKVNLKKEIYLGLIVDRKKALPLLIVSPKGGMGIEEIGSEYILQEFAESLEGFSETQLEKIAKFLELESLDQEEKIKQMIKKLFKCFNEKDALMIEINPLGVLTDNRLVICDSKVKIDDNSKPRQKALFDQEDLTQKDPKEVEAEANDLNYVKLTGSVGCLVNGEIGRAHV